MTQDEGERNADRLLAEYREAIAQSDRMLQQAQQGAWEALIDEGMDYLVLAGHLSVQPDTYLSFTQRRERQVYLQQLLDNDRRIRARLDGRMQELGPLVEQERQRSRTSSKQVLHAYHRFSKG